MKYILYHSKPYLKRLMAIPFARERDFIGIDEMNHFFQQKREENISSEEANERWGEYLANKQKGQ